MKAICIMNLKGGVGKTVTAINMGAILARDYQKRVLLIDCDSQHNTTDFFGVENSDGCLSQLLQSMTELREDYYQHYIQDTEIDRLSVLAGDDGLMDLDITHLRSGQVSQSSLRDLIVALEEDNEYDFVIYDCPPAFNAASAAALAASTDVVIPIKLDAFSLSGLNNLLKQIFGMRRINPRLRVDGCLITMYTKAAEEAARQLREVNPAVLPVLSTQIRRSDKVDGSTFAGDPLMIYSPRSAAGVDYRRFVAELMGQIGGNLDG